MVRHSEKNHMKLSAVLLTFCTFAANAAAAQQPAAQQPARGTPLRLSLDEALRIAQRQSQTIEVARAGVTRATGQQIQARSQYLPQLNGTAGYTKTLESQFSSFASSSTAPDA